jgi:alpha-L-fucosidase 2
VFNLCFEPAAYAHELTNANCFTTAPPSRYVYNDYHDCTRESCCVNFPCTKGPHCPSCGVPNVNPSISIAFIRRIFSHLIVAAAALGVNTTTDASDVAAWRDVLDHMPSFSTPGRTEASQFPVGVACPGNDTDAGSVECDNGTLVLLPQGYPFYFKATDNPLQLYAVWPGEQISLGSDPSLLAVARNSIDLTAALVSDNAPPEVFTAAVRVG